MKKSYPLILALVLIVALVVRVLFLDRVPPSIFIDEFNLALPAAKLVLGNYSLAWYDFGWYATPGLFFYYLGLFMVAFGPSLMAIKFAWLAPSLLLVPLATLFSWLLFRSKFITLTTLLLVGFNVPIVNISRWGHGSLLTGVMELLVLVIFWMATTVQRKSGYWLMALAALLAGISLYLYVGARSFVLALPLLLIWYWVFSGHRLRQKSMNSVVFIGVLIVTALPLLRQLWLNQFEVIWRIQEVSILQSELSVGENLMAVGNNAQLYLRMFIDQIDKNLRHNPMQETVFPIGLGLFALMGLGVPLLGTWYRKPATFLLLGVLMTMLGGVLSSEAPSYFRVFGSLPLLCIIIATSLYIVIRRLVSLFERRQRLVIQALLLGILMSIQLISLGRYFVTMFNPTQAITDAFSLPELQIARAVSEYVSTSMPVYVATDYLYSSTQYLTLPLDARTRFQLFDIDILNQLDRPSVLVLGPESRSLKPLFNMYFTVLDLREIESNQFHKPLLYEIEPDQTLPTGIGWQLKCIDQYGAETDRQSLGIYHSFASFPNELRRCSWKGLLRIDQTGEYQLRAKADDVLGFTLRGEDGTTVFDQSPRPNWSRSLFLNEGDYVVIAEYVNSGGAQSAILEWVVPNRESFEIIDPLKMRQVVFEEI